MKGHIIHVEIYKFSGRLDLGMLCPQPHNAGTKAIVEGIEVKAFADRYCCGF